MPLKHKKFILALQPHEGIITQTQNAWSPRKQSLSFCVSLLLLIGLAFSTDASGGNITYSGGYTIHTFYGDGTLDVPQNMSVEVLVVAGGGEGGFSSGGGAGGLIYNNSFAITAGNITVTVGAGGSGTITYPTIAYNGTNSIFSSLTAIGGGGGGAELVNGANGGSGGGAGAASTGISYGGNGTANQGTAGGGNANHKVAAYPGGGGGGASKSGGNATADDIAGIGGNGTDYSSSFGTSVGDAGWFAGGGAGWCYLNCSASVPGGKGGGGNATKNGAANTGGGGGGYPDLTGGNPGGSGIVIVRYLTASADTYASLTVINGSGANASFTVPRNKTITASTITNYTFSTWWVVSGNATINNASNITTFVIFLNTSSNTTVQANYTENPKGNLTIYYTAGGTAGTSQTNFYTPATFNITATQNWNYTFNNWTTIQGNCTVGNALSNETNATISSGTCNITATFTYVPPNQTIASLVVINGSGSASNFNTPANKSITANTITNYTFNNWTITAGNASLFNQSASTYAIFLNTSGNTTVQANYNYTPPAPTGNLTITCTGGTCTANKTGGNTPWNASITAMNNSGYNWTNWTITSGNCTLGNASAQNTTAALLSGDCALAANFIYGGACSASLAFSSLMTPANTIITLTTYSNLVSFLNIVQLNQIGCEPITTSHAYDLNGVEINNLTSTLDGLLYFNHTNLPLAPGLDRKFTFSAETLLNNGTTLSTGNRTVYLLGESALTIGGGNMIDIGTGFILFGGIMWLTAAYIYLQRKALALAFPFYIFGIILFFTATIASAEAAAALGNYGTMNMMFMLMIGLQWLLLISIGAAFLYIIIMIIDWLAKLINVRLEKRNLEGKL